MTSDTTTLIVDLALIVFMAVGTLLFLTLIVAFIALFPTIRRILGLTSRRSAGMRQRRGKILLRPLQSAKEAAADMALLARTAASNAPEIAEKVQEISENVRTATIRVADASRLLELIGAPQDAAGQGLAALGQLFKKLMGR